jgi:nicotinamide-nucleotide amidase
LNDAGIDVRRKTVVGDHRADLAGALRGALDRVDLIVTTGGLGPTDDDVTREVVAEVLALPLDESASLLEQLRARFARRGLDMPEINRRQAQVPRGALVMANPNGTAPGLLIDAGDRLVVCLPGPARELKPIVEAHLMPVLVPRGGGIARRRRVITLAGQAESRVEELVRPLDDGLRQGPVVVDRTILASPGVIEIHLMAAGADAGLVEEALALAAQAVAGRLGRAVVSITGEPLEEVVGHQLQARGWKVAAAESCTGGLLLGRMTEVAGSSAWVAGGVVAYANAVKVELLGVDAGLIDVQGAVSEPVALAMARGARVRLSADVGVAITGIAGPAGGSEAKPVGTVFIATSFGAGVEPDRVRACAFPGDREMVRAFSVAAALDLLRRGLETR